MFDYDNLMKVKAAEAMLDAICLLRAEHEDDEDEILLHLEDEYDRLTIYNDNPYYYDTSGSPSARVSGQADKAVKLLFERQENPRTVKSWFPPLSDDWTDSRIELMDYILMKDSFMSGWDDCWAETYSCQTVNEIETKMYEIIRNRCEEPDIADTVFEIEAIQELEDWD